MSQANTNPNINDIPPSGNTHVGWETLVCKHGLDVVTASPNNLELVPLLLPTVISLNAEIFEAQIPYLQLAPAATLLCKNMTKRADIRHLLLTGATIGMFTDRWKDDIAKDSEDCISHLNNRYKQYPDQPLNSRVTETPRLSGTSMMLTVDGIPYVLTLPWEASDAVDKRALPINTLVNAIIERNSSSFGFVASSLSQREAESKSQQIRFS